MRQKILLYINLSIVSFFILTGIALAVWNGPTTNPPGDNVPLPLNISADPQSKANGLVLNTGGFVVGLVVSSGAVTLPDNTVDTNEVNFNYAASATKGGPATNIAGGAAGSVPYQTAAGSTTMLAAGANGKVLKIISGVPGWGDDIDTDTDTDNQQLQSYAWQEDAGLVGDNQKVLAITGGNQVVVPYSSRAGGIYAGDTNQIPYQIGVSKTGFDANLTWEPAGGGNRNLIVKGGGSCCFAAQFTNSSTGSFSSLGYWKNGIFAGTRSTDASGFGGVFDNNVGSPIITTGVSGNNGYSIDGNGPISGTQYCFNKTNCISSWTSSNTPNAIVKRDGSGNFSAHKITADIYDPVYSINGVNYATYLSGMTGLKEETAGLIKLTLQPNGKYGYVFDFNNIVVGSDIWLFAKVTDLKNHLGNLSVILTPAFDGRVWYEKDPLHNNLTVYGISNSSNLEVSYRLTAPRFDANEWSNYNYDLGVKGLIIAD